MKKYVETFIKMKIENSGVISEEECDEINKYHVGLGFDFKICCSDCKMNKGLRQVSKICLNSLWGKFGRSNLDSYEFVKTYASFIKKLCDKTLNVKTWDILHEDCVEMRFCEDSDKSIEADYISEITAIFTTSNARMRLYDFLSWMHPTQLIYCDTDSCYYLYDETNPLHKKAGDKHPTIKFGSGLGQWNDEFKGSYATEMVCAVAKSYAVKMANGSIKMAQKGITIDCNNSEIFTFEKMKNMVINDSTIKSAERYQFKWEKKNIITTYMSREIQTTVNSKRLVEGYDTLPVGIDKKAYRLKQWQDSQ